MRVLLPLILAALPVGSATVLFDFEVDQDIALWHNEGAQGLGADKTLERDGRFATRGAHSMRFRTQAWRPEEHGGRQKWPAFEGAPPLADWSGHDRLVFDIVNETAEVQRLMLFLTDSKKPTRQGLSHRETLPPRSHVRAVVDLAKGFREKGIDAADIRVLHLYTEDPPVDMVLYLDGFVLLEPGEPLPVLPGEFTRQVAALYGEELRQAQDGFSARRDAMLAKVAGQERIAAWLARGLREPLDAAGRLTAILAAGGEEALAVPAKVQALRERLDHLEALLDLRLDFEPLRAAVAMPGAARDDIVPAVATSMEKVLPRGPKARLKVTDRLQLRLAANETESVQVLVVPCEQGAVRAVFRTADLASATGHVFPASGIRVSPVGYVETKAVPPYGSSHVGWWPDPILDFMDSADLAEGDVQAFWLRVTAPRDQAPGEYAGAIRLEVEGKGVLRLPLLVRVYGFSLPTGSPLPLAITFAPHDHPLPEEKGVQEAWRQEPDYPINAWKTQRGRWVDFLADYGITLDSLYEYGGWAPDFEALSRLKQQGRLGRFNLGYFSKCPEGAEAAVQWAENILGKLRPRYEKARELGLLEHAYIYGCDEHGEEDFPHVERAARVLKGAFPEVSVMTTTYDHSFGLESALTTPDAYCPLTPRYDPERAARARAAGKEVWWYICCGPRHPHANMFIEYPAIEGRLLMGAMTAKYRPDGFLYYQISIWNSRRPIQSGPFTDWNPRSWTTWHGDGAWTCVGPGGTPIPTIRLENFRDGLEDFAYVRILEATLAAVRANATVARDQAPWIRQAEEALAVPEEVVTDLKTYTTDPACLYRYREALAAAIEASPIGPVYPEW
ncbi:MAG: DUF4091 domain-containing protein [Lentisphaeria bacterium]|nr:DUF4091 domain-containing protein [Lentisphaeria bacterium]